MEKLENFLLLLVNLPSEQMVGIVALAGICLAGFAIHVVHSVVRREKDK